MAYKLHELKSWPKYFEASLHGEKNFEVRKNDRDFQRGDRLTLREWNPDTKEYTGRTLNAIVGRVYELDSLGYDGVVVFNVIGWNCWTDGNPNNKDGERSGM